MTLGGLWEGWLFIGLGFAIYLGIALSALNSARWYTTRFFSVIFAIFVLCWMFYLSSISAAFGLLAISTVCSTVQANSNESNAVEVHTAIHHATSCMSDSEGTSFVGTMGGLLVLGSDKRLKQRITKSSPRLRAVW